ncbi:hypothetical protein [Pseudochrobactrum sp. MP213Fo]|uniref:hypothetical protein n=1 Tax=Pseudochrobactrum sp. MP213Fo TaxID=3022250 RepID=UPI003BA01721
MRPDQKDFIRDTFIDLDDLLGQLYDAIDVVEALTKGTIANKAVNPLSIHLLQMQNAVKNIWPVAVRGQP